MLPNPVSAVGQHFSYRLAVTNSGNQTIRNIIVTDPLLPDLVYTIATLAPQGELFCSDNSYAVTQADVDRGNLVNNAFVAGTTPPGWPCQRHGHGNGPDARQCACTSIDEIR